MQYKRNQMSVGLMVQRCHRWRQKRKQLIDQARATQDEIERERFLQMAEHFGRVVNAEQSKIDTKRDPVKTDAEVEKIDEISDDDDEFSDFKNQ